MALFEMSFSSLHKRQQSKKERKRKKNKNMYIDADITKEFLIFVPCTAVTAKNDNNTSK